MRSKRVEPVRLNSLPQRIALRLQRGQFAAEFLLAQRDALPRLVQRHASCSTWARAAASAVSCASVRSRLANSSFSSRSISCSAKRTSCSMASACAGVLTESSLGADVGCLLAVPVNLALHARAQRLFAVQRG